MTSLHLLVKSDLKSVLAFFFSFFFLEQRGGNGKPIPFPIHYRVWIVFQNENRNQKFFLLETKPHFC